MTDAWMTHPLGRDVHLRPGTSDQQVWTETFVGQHHLPPDTSLVPRTVLDLGANIGLVAAHYRALWPNAKIVAVEMDADCCHLIRQNAPGVEVARVAVGGTEGLGSYDPDLPAYERAFRLGNLDGTVVESATLSRIIDGHFLHGVDLVKMDVEGAEWGLFETAYLWAPLVRRLLAELHGDGTPDVLVAHAMVLLEAAGYTVARHPGHPQAVWATR